MVPDTERPLWSEHVKRVMRRIETLLPLAPSEATGVDRRRHLEHMTTLLQRFGTQRSDPIASMLAHLGNYWTSGILVMLHAGPLRPSTVQKLLASQTPEHPISSRMLTLNLRALEDDGLIERVVYASRRAHVEYQLTSLGQGLCHQLLAVIEWGAEHIEQIVAARAAQAHRSRRRSGSH